jgi:hypothetical protein
MLNLAQARGFDPILTKMAIGYQDFGDFLGNWLAPIVPVDRRAGRYPKFGVESFAAIDTLRAPLTKAGTVESSFTFGSFNLEQHSLAYRISEEFMEECTNGESQIDLRQMFINDMMGRFQRAHEIRVFSTVLSAMSRANNFSAGSAGNVLLGSDAWSSPTADIVRNVRIWGQNIADVIGQPPNSMIIGSRVAISLSSYGYTPNALPSPYRTWGAPSMEQITATFDCSRGVKVANKRALALDGSLRYIFDPDAILLFYAPPSQSSDATRGVLPADNADRHAPALAYTFQLKQSPRMTKERFDEDHRFYTSSVLADRKVKVVGPSAGIYVKVQNTVTNNVQ